MHGLMREGRESQPCRGYLDTARRKGRPTDKPRLPRWVTCSLLYHDYQPNGTTTLFAALNVQTGTVIGECLPKHRHDEFLRFMRKLDRQTDQDLAVHLIVDNYATHKHPNVKDWLAKHPRFHLHFTPTSAS